MLKQEYKEEEMALKDALKLAVKVLDKTLDITKLTPDKGNHCQKGIQGCALRAPGCIRRLTFAFGQPDNLISFI